ncbi:unnamed protein product [Paramecium primaurelia]|uniref:Uncharacterized protein n=1 Tax=Paramecium primaurelia TaxID=5886 RepID=A0A8S1PNM7_PARPR|nr:unnamed protein product [Paramecium primaurelia]
MNQLIYYEFHYVQELLVEEVILLHQDQQSMMLQLFMVSIQHQLKSQLLKKYSNQRIRINKIWKYSKCKTFIK